MSGVKGKAWKEKLRTDVDFAFSNKKNHTLHAYIDIAGGLVEGTLLTQILYWCGNNKDESSGKLKVFRNGEYWLAKGRECWWEEVRITPRQFDTAVKNLKKKKLIETALFHFGGVPTTHVRPIYEEINKAIDEWKENYKRVIEEENGQEKYERVNSNLQNCKLADCENNNLQNGEMEIADLQNANNNINNNIDSDTEITNRDYSTENTPNSFSNEKDNSKPNGLEIYNSQVGELGTPKSEIAESETDKQKNNITMTLGRKERPQRKHELQDMPTRAKEIAYEFMQDEDLSDKAYNLVQYFMDYYKACTGTDHLNLTDPVLKRVVWTMLNTITLPIETETDYFENDYYPLIDREIDIADSLKVVEKYFETEFRYKVKGKEVSVKKSLVHFTEPGVLTKIMNKCSIGEDGHWYESHEPY